MSRVDKSIETERRLRMPLAGHIGPYGAIVKGYRNENCFKVVAGHTREYTEMESCYGPRTDLKRLSSNEPPT
jgi:hypothetical protein